MRVFRHENFELSAVNVAQGEKRIANCEIVSLSAIGFNVETVTYKNLKFQVWDLGGQTSIR